jgi:hypothetical protein
MSKMRTWAVLAGAVIVVILAAGWFGAVSPQKAKVKGLHTDTANEQVKNQQLSGKIRLLKSQQSDGPAEIARIAAIEDRIPATPALTAYVRTLADLAAQNHVELVSVSPTAPTAVSLTAPVAAVPAAAAASGAATPAAVPAAAAAPALSAISITINVVGDYYAVQQFLTKLEDTKRATIVSTVSLAPGQLPKSSTATESTSTVPGVDTQWKTLQAQIVASIFMSGVADTSNASAVAKAVPPVSQASATPGAPVAPTAPVN